MWGIASRHPLEVRSWLMTAVTAVAGRSCWNGALSFLLA